MANDNPNDWLLGPNSAISQLSGALNGTTAQNQAAQANAQAQMQFQSNMADTAHQREVADLKAAGLNPILSAGGSGAPSPAGVSAPVQANNIGGTMTNLMSSVLGLAGMVIQGQGLTNATMLAGHQANLMDSQAVSTLANSAKNQSLQPLWDLLGEFTHTVKNGINSLNPGGAMSTLFGNINNSAKSFGFKADQIQSAGQHASSVLGNLFPGLFSK